jgi:hypothetical protein
MTAVIYNTYPRTRFGICWMLGILAIPALALSVARWIDSGQIRTALDVVWVLAITAVTIRLLLRLGRLERVRPEPDDGMEIAFEAILLVPIVGLIPMLLLAARLL